MNLLKLTGLPSPSAKKELPRRPYLFYLCGFKVSQDDGSTYVATHYSTASNLPIAEYEFM